MIKKHILLILVLFTSMLAGCASPDSAPDAKRASATFRDVRTVSVLAFNCSDPLIAQDIRNTIIQSLLSSYSIILGEKADVVISGAITLAPDKGVTEIKAAVIKKSEQVESFVITPSGRDMSFADSAEVMGKKTGSKLREILSR